MHHAAPHQPDDRRGRGHRRRLPRPRAPHRRARVADEGRDGRARARRDRRRRPADPGRHRRLDHFLEPTFEGSPYFDELRPVRRADRLRADPRRAARPAGHRARLLPLGAPPGTAARMRERLRPLYTLFVHKWYFDELIDAPRRPARPRRRALRRSRRSSASFVDGLLVGGTTGVVRAGSAAVRASQNGFLRVYAALFVLGLVAVALYFLLQLVTLPSRSSSGCRSPPRWSAGAAGRARARASPSSARCPRSPRDRTRRRLRHRRAGCSTSPTRRGSASWASTTSSASTG